MGGDGDRAPRLLGDCKSKGRLLGMNGWVRTSSYVPLTLAMLTPHLPYSVTLIYSHDADDGRSESEDDIGDYLGGVGRG